MGKALNFELRRKAFHVILGIAIILMAIFIAQAKWILFYCSVIGMLISIASIYMKIPLISFFLDKFERPRYRKKFPGKGVLFFIAGSLLVLKLFPQNIALASIAVLTFSDPFFSFEKRSYKFFKAKNLTGLFLGILFSTVAASVFIPVLWALFAAVSAAIAESITIFLEGDNVDDNIVIPIIAGTLLYLIMP